MCCSWECVLCIKTWGVYHGAKRTEYQQRRSCKGRAGQRRKDDTMGREGASGSGWIEKRKGRAAGTVNIMDAMGGLVTCSTCFYSLAAVY